MTPDVADAGNAEIERPVVTEPAVAGGPSYLMDNAPEGVTLEIAAAALRERVYGSITCLSTLLVITGYQPLDHPWSKLFDVMIATGGLWTASVLAEVISHLGAHQKAPGPREMRHIFWVSGQIVAASTIPLVLLLLAALTVIPLHSAVWAGVWVLVAEMGVFAFLAVRGTSLSRRARTLLIAALLLLGLLVVVLKNLAH